MRVLNSLDCEKVSARNVPSACGKTPRVRLSLFPMSIVRVTVGLVAAAMRRGRHEEQYSVSPQSLHEVVGVAVRVALFTLSN